jgi:hypothetical protein
MDGWSEDEIKNKELMAPCGLYCGTCGVYIAGRDKNEKFRSVMGGLYGTKPEETSCAGCMQPDPPTDLYVYCKMCTIRDCVKSKGFYSCHQCDDWPCEQIKNFGLETGKQVMMRTIPVWREKVAELGDGSGNERLNPMEIPGDTKKMTTLVVGASGATGRLLVEQLLHRGHAVRVIVRTPTKLSEDIEQHPLLILI